MGTLMQEQRKRRWLRLACSPWWGLQRRGRWSERRARLRRTWWVLIRIGKRRHVAKVWS